MKRTRVVGYIRVSTEEQAAEGVSLAAQEARLRAYAVACDLDLVAVEVDAGVSAKGLRRPGLEAALARLDRGEAGGLLVAKLDRLTRSVRDLGALLDGYFGPDAPGRHQLLSVGDAIDTRTAAGRLVLNILTTVAQWEREAIVERTRAAIAHKRSQGERIGTIPFGMCLHPDGRTLIPDFLEQEAIGEILRWRGAGRSLRWIAAELDRLEVPTKAGRSKWSHTTVAKILEREHAEAT
jgi:DNA invertase Pin-like site-specific DNA recombinase